MFNYEKIRRLQEENGVLQNRLDRLQACTRQLLVYLGRNSIFSSYPEYSVEHWVAELKEELIIKEERAKIESIVRDLLKKNVFKEVKK